MTANVNVHPNVNVHSTLTYLPNQTTPQPTKGVYNRLGIIGWYGSYGLPSQGRRKAGSTQKPGLPPITTGYVRYPGKTSKRLPRLVQEMRPLLERPPGTELLWGANRDQRRVRQNPKTRPPGRCKWIRSGTPPRSGAEYRPTVTEQRNRPPRRWRPAKQLLGEPDGFDQKRTRQTQRGSPSRNVVRRVLREWVS